ncbi:hypothetical protein BSKO_02562 [Bryopsis sp. KO-2023]|nr:hypothetical protein BSKO_02562 [Bryopsis sp. KO-2023]
MPVELDAGWASMQMGIDKLIRILEGDPDVDQFNADEYMRQYTVIYDMCTQKPPHDYSEELYGRYRQSFETYIRTRVIRQFSDMRDEYLLRELHKRWDNHKIMVRWLSRFFNYLDRYYVGRHSLDSLKVVGDLTFKELVYTTLKDDARQAVLLLLYREREGESVDRALLKNILDLFITMGMDSMECYEQDFEFDMLKATTEYYRVRAAVWINEDSCPEYMVKAEECLRLEEERVANYLDPSSKVKLLQCVETELLANHKGPLLDKEHSGCRALLRDDKVDDLSRMYRLFHRIPSGLEPVSEIFRQHVESEGMKRVKDATQGLEERRLKVSGKPGRDGSSSHEQKYVRSVIELHDKYMQFVTTCFSNSPLFHRALKEAFESFCNKTVAGCSSAELFANFSDSLLRKSSSEKLSDNDIEATLDKVVKLLAYISDKDLFAEFYRKKLARRLLFEKSNNDEHEQSILSRLKQQCGAQFTSKMEGMVTDLQLAREKETEFEEWTSGCGKKLGIDMSVQVLTTGFWPTYKAIDLALPEEMELCVQVFKSFYETTTKHRKLTWMYTLGNCTVRGSFDKQTLDIVLNTLQAAVLLAFNQAEMLSYNEVKERLNLQDDDVMRSLHSLSCGKYKILLKDPEGRLINKNDVFRLNVQFQDKMRRIKVPLPPVDERRKVVEDVDKDRRGAIDAAVVRTMKSRKTLQHQQLVLEVNQQLQRMFKPDIKQIKRRIDDLIAREYLERDKINRNVYNYLA